MKSPMLHHRTCTLCEAACGVEVHLRDGQVHTVRGDRLDPFGQGSLCPKALALKDLHEDPDRLRQPLRRQGDGFVPVSWATALDEAAERIHALQRRHGRHAMATYLGNPNVHNLPAMLATPSVLRALHTKNRFSATSVDQLPHMFAAYQMFGHQLLMPIPDIDRTDFMLILGANPAASGGSLMTAPGIRRRLRAIIDRGGEVVVLDPRRTETARIATEHCFVRPGTDALLLMSLLHRVFERGDDRLGRLRGFTRGVTELKAAVEDFAPDVTAAHTGLAPEVVDGLVSRLVATRRAVVYGRMGTSTQRFGGLCAWLVTALNAVTGHLDREGGAMFPQPAIDLVGLGGRVGFGRGSHGRWRSRVRGLAEFSGELPVAALAEEISTPGEGQVRGLLTVAGNPVLSTPNGARLDEALGSLELMISVDPYINETTRHADLVLPPVSVLERVHYDLIFHHLAVRNTAKLSEPLFVPPAGALDDGQILLGLARRLVTRRHGRFSRAALALALQERLKPQHLLDLGLRAGPYGAGANLFVDGLSLKRLRENPHGVDLGPLEPCLPERLHRKHAHLDLAPAPMLDDVDRLRRTLDESVEGFLLIGRRHRRDNNSWMHNSVRLMKGRERCTLLVHPDDAAHVGVGDGDRARLASRVGELEVQVVLSDEVMPGVLSLPHGYGHDRPGVRLRVARTYAGVSANDLTDEMVIDELTGTAVLNGVSVTLESFETRR